MTTLGKTAITVEATVNASMKKVWECWNEPQHITKWYQASDDWHAPHASNDLQKSGKLMITMAAKDGSVSFDFESIYDKVKEHSLIEYTILDGRKVIIEFIEKGDHVKVVETFETEKTHPIDVQRGGWQAILDSFKNYVESI